MGKNFSPRTILDWLTKSSGFEVRFASIAGRKSSVTPRTFRLRLESHTGGHAIRKFMKKGTDQITQVLFLFILILTFVLSIFISFNCISLTQAISNIIQSLIASTIIVLLVWMMIDSRQEKTRVEKQEQEIKKQEQGIEELKEWLCFFYNRFFVNLCALLNDVKGTGLLNRRLKKDYTFHELKNYFDSINMKLESSLPLNEEGAKYRANLDWNNFFSTYCDIFIQELEFISNRYFAYFDADLINKINRLVRSPFIFSVATYYSYKSPEVYVQRQDAAQEIKDFTQRYLDLEVWINKVNKR